MDYSLIFSQIALVSMFVLGFRTITNKGRIGYFLKYPLEQIIFNEKGDIMEWIAKPLITCIGCMPSVWGTAIFFLSSIVEPMPLYYWPLCVIPCCFICSLAWEVIRYFEPVDYS